MADPPPHTHTHTPTLAVSQRLHTPLARLPRKEGSRTAQCGRNAWYSRSVSVNGSTIVLR